MSLTQFAWAERYVSPAGAGAKTGLNSNFSDAMDLVAMLADLAQGRRYNMAGSFAPTSSVVVSGTGGSATNPLMFRGFKADLSGPAVDFSDMPVFDHTAHGGAGWVVISYQILQGFEVKNVSGDGISGGLGDNIIFDLMHVHDCGGSGIAADDQCSTTRCRIHDVNVRGVFHDSYSLLALNEVYGCGNDGLEGDDYSVFVGNYVRDCATRGIDTQTATNSKFLFNTSDANPIGIYGNAASGPFIFVGNQVTNNTVGVQNFTGINLFIHNNFHGNTADDSTVTAFAEFLTQYADPTYVAIGSNDYTVQTLAQLGIEFLATLGTYNIGAFQGGGGGGGGVSAARAGISGPAGSANYYWPNIGG